MSKASTPTPIPAPAPSPTIPPLRPDAAFRDAQTFLDQTVGWFSSHWLQILIGVAVGTAIVLALHAVRHVGSRLCSRDGSGTGWTSVLGRAIARTGTVFLVMLAAKLVASYAGAPVAVMATIKFLFTVTSVFQGAVWTREIILGAVERRANSDHYAGETLGTALGIIRFLVTFTVFGVALVLVLDNLGVNVTGLVAGLGVGGIAIGLAAQGIFADLFAALAIIFDRPFKRGDSVSYDQTSGSIESIGLKSTRIRSFTGEERIIANKKLLDKEITNNTARNHRRAKFTLGFAYETPVDKLRAVPAMAQEIVERHERLFIRCGLVAFAASTIDFELEFDSDGADYVAFYDGRTAVALALYERFNAEGLVLQYPVRLTYLAGPDGRPMLPTAAGAGAATSGDGSSAGD